MAPRSQWKGHLKLSLVTCAVALYTAVSSSERTRFNTLNRATGHRVRRQFIDAATAEVVEPEDQIRGYEIGKDTYVVVEKEEIDAVALESTHTIDIDRFVERRKVDSRYFDTPYYLAPNDAIAQQAFAVIRDAMKQKAVVGLARVVLSRRERLLMLEPFGNGMLATTLRYSYEVRDEAPYFSEIESVDLPKEMLDLASHIIQSKLGEFDLSGFDDRYENALVDLIRQKQKGAPITARPVPPRPGNVVDLMQALRQSLSSADRAKPTAPAARRSKPRSERGSATRKGRRRAG